MQAYFETAFNILYLSFVIIICWSIYKKSKSSSAKLFGIMALVLGFGDAFHLVPRSYALFTTGLEANAGALGFGKLVTSVTMTLFYLILFYLHLGVMTLKNMIY